MANLFDRLNPAESAEQDIAIDDATLINKINTNHHGTVFFCGAGFSKAWNEKYPLGDELFSIEGVDENKYNFLKFANDLDIIKPKKNSNGTALENTDAAAKADVEYVEQCYDYFKEIKFHLDNFIRYPSLMPTYLDPTTINALENEMKLFIRQRFIDLVGAGELNIKQKINTTLYTTYTDFFNHILTAGKNISFITTNYDYIIEKILRNTAVFKASEISINRGVVDPQQFNQKSWQRRKISVFKINGGFEIHKKNGHSYIDYKNSPNEAPNIILPSQEQNYSDPYFKNIFLKSANKLREANLLIFIGYSFPAEDHTIRFLLKNFIDTNNTDKEIVIIGRNQASALATRNKAALLYPNLAKRDAIYGLNGNLATLLGQGILAIQLP